jgi:dTMP kinase
LDAYTIDFYQRVRQGYFKLAEADPQRWEIIDANRSLDQVQEEIRKVVGERLKRHK